jgi:hypothetical protein
MIMTITALEELNLLLPLISNILLCLAVLHALAPFQRDAVKFVLNNAGRALLADEMGLGTSISFY